MPQWGANSSNSTKPTWEYLTGQQGHVGNVANVFATSQGWVHRWPWGDEVLVAIGGLDEQLNPAGVSPLVMSLLLLTPATIPNIQTTNVQVLLLINEAVTVNGTPTLRAISNGGAGELANLVLTYVSGSSDPTAGKLVFANTTAGAVGNVNSTVNGVIAGNGSITFKINATSTFLGTLILDKEEADDVSCTTPGNVSATFPAAFAQTFSIVAYTPDLPLAGIVPVSGTVHPTTGQTFGFRFNFNEAMTVTGTPTVLAKASAGPITDKTLTYDPVTSNTANGSLVFSIAAVDLTSGNSLSYVINASSTLVGFSGLVGAVSGNLVQNTIGYSGNTKVIAAS